MHASLSLLFLAALSTPSLARLDRREARPAMSIVAAISQIDDGQIQVPGPGVTESRTIVTPLTTISTTPAPVPTTSNPTPPLRIAPDVPSPAKTRSSTPTTVAPIPTIAPPAGPPVALPATSSVPAATALIAAPVVAPAAPAIISPAETHIVAPASPIAPVISTVLLAVPSIGSLTIMASSFNATIAATSLAPFSISLVPASSTSSTSMFSSAAAISTSNLSSSSVTAAATNAAKFTGDGERTKVGLTMGVLVVGAIGALLM